MSFDARFDLPTDFYDDEDISNCTNCPHRHCNCFNAGRCLMEEY